MRREIEAQRPSREPKTHGVATRSHVYNCRDRQLGARLAQAQHEHHDVVVSATRVPLDHQNCLESVMLKGLAAVPVFADRVQAERGMRHGQLNLVAVHTSDVHVDTGTHRHHGHLHLMPRS